MPPRARAVAAAIAVAALAVTTAVCVAGVATTPRHFGFRDARLILTFVEIFFCGLCVTFGLRLLQRSWRDAFGALAVLVGTATFVLFAVATWDLSLWDDGERWGKIVGTAFVVLVAMLAVAGARTLQQRGSLHALALLSVVVAAALVDVVIALADIWSVSPTEGDVGTDPGQVGGTVAAAATMIGVAAFLAIPLADHLRALRRR